MGKGLTKQDVVDAAAAVVEADGVAALTLTRVAKELRIKPPSLYNHVSKLDALCRDVALDVVEDFGGRLAVAAMGLAGRDAMAAVAEEFRRYAIAHPGLYELSTRARPEDEEYAEASLRAIQPVVAVLRGYGLDGDEAIHAARAFRSALHGFVSLENGGGFGLEVDVDASYTWLIDHFAAVLDSSRPAG